MKRIQWPDGVTAEAQTWGELLEKLRLDQWSVTSALRFRFELRRRAEIVSGYRIPFLTLLTASADRFAFVLASAELFTILEDT